MGKGRDQKSQKWVMSFITIVGHSRETCNDDKSLKWISEGNYTSSLYCGKTLLSFSTFVKC